MNDVSRLRKKEYMGDKFPGRVSLKFFQTYRIDKLRCYTFLDAVYIYYKYRHRNSAPVSGVGNSTHAVLNSTRPSPVQFSILFTVFLRTSMTRLNKYTKKNASIPPKPRMKNFPENITIPTVHLTLYSRTLITTLSQSQRLIYTSDLKYPVESTAKTYILEYILQQLAYIRESRALDYTLFILSPLLLLWLR